MENLTKLTPNIELKKEQKKLFALNFIKSGGNIKKATTMTGITSSTGSNWLKDPYVITELEIAHNNLQSKSIMSAEEVLELWTSIARGEIEEEEIVVEAFKGVATARAIKRATPLSIRLKASELMAKSMNLLRPAPTINNQMVIINNENNLED